MRSLHSTATSRLPVRQDMLDHNPAAEVVWHTWPEGDKDFQFVLLKPLARVRNSSSSLAVLSCRDHCLLCGVGRKAEVCHNRVWSMRVKLSEITSGLRGGAGPKLGAREWAGEVVQINCRVQGSVSLSKPALACDAHHSHTQPDCFYRTCPDHSQA